MLEQAVIDEHARRIGDRGYSIVENAIEADLVDALCVDLERLETELRIEPAPNEFEGSATLRVYNLLALAEVWQQVPIHENVIPVVESVLDKGCLISSLSSINIGPGETPQPLHADDQLLPLPKPHVPIVCNTMWALTDFTEANGATRLVPGSHTADHDPTYGGEFETVAAEMPRGSVLIWNGSLWHGGGANHTDTRRVGIAMNYCAGWVRQQENQQLGIPPRLVKTFPRRLQRLIGYGIYNGLVGHIDKHDPVELLGSDKDDGTMLIWDYT